MDKTKKVKSKAGRKPKWGDGEGAVIHARIPQEADQVLTEAAKAGPDKGHRIAVYVLRGMMAEGLLNRTKYRAILKNAQMAKAS